MNPNVLLLGAIGLAAVALLGGMAYLRASHLGRMPGKKRGGQTDQSEFQRLVQESPSIIFQADVQGKGTFVNDARWQEITGRGAGSWMGDGWIESLHPDDRQRVVEKWQKTVATGELWRDEFRFQRPDGTSLWVAGLAGAVRNPDGELGGYVGLCTEISELKLAHDRLDEIARREQALRQSEARNRALLKAIPDFMFRLRGDGLFLDYLANQEEKLAIPPEQFMHRSIYQCMPVEFAEMMMKCVRAALQTGTMQVIEYRLPSTLAPEDKCDYEARIVVSGENEVMVIVRDVSDRKRAEEKLREKELQLTHVSRLSTMGELVAGIAHEVNQPLYSILNFAKASANVLARIQEPQIEPLRQWNHQISEAAHRAGEIIKRLRRFISPRTERTLSDLTELIRESAQLVSLEARRCGARVEFDLAQHLPPVMVDRVQIQQVLINLLKNAYEAMDEASVIDPAVTIRMRITGDSVEVVVEDNGPGLPWGQTNLFDAFSTTKSGGMGMGLAISKTIVEAHGGQLWDTAGNGTGASLHFTLPLAG